MRGDVYKLLFALPTYNEVYLWGTTCQWIIS